MWPRFLDRRDAGRALSAALIRYAGNPDLLVLGLPRGGVPVAYEVAQALGAPLDVFVVRKLGFPGQEELAMGAIASGGVRVMNRELVEAEGVPEQVVEEVAAKELLELMRRERLFRGDRPPVEVRGRQVILVDDGLATGSTMRAAVQAVRGHSAGRVIVAVPVAPDEVCARIAAEADELVCLVRPEIFFAVGSWYEDFRQTSDDEVRELLSRAWGTARSPEARA